MTIDAWVRSVHKIFLVNINVAKSILFGERNNNTNGVKFEWGSIPVCQSMRFFSWFEVYKSVYLVPRQMRKIRLVSLCQLKR
jgi:hypothetical protein